MKFEKLSLDKFTKLEVEKVEKVYGGCPTVIACSDGSTDVQEDSDCQ